MAKNNMKLITVRIRVLKEEIFVLLIMRLWMNSFKSFAAIIEKENFL
jgi:hypothetical protein